MNTRVARILGLMLFASLALALPASASAGILYSGASEVPVGTKIAGNQGTGIQFKSGGTQVVECSKAVLSGTVRSNTAWDVQITVEGLNLYGAGVEGRCSSGLVFGDPAISLQGSACWQHSSKAQWGWRGAACGVETTATRLLFAYKGGTNCVYQRTTTVALVGNIGTEPLIVGVPATGQEFIKESGPVGCPPSLELYNLQPELKTSSGAGLKVIS